MKKFNLFAYVVAVAILSIGIVSCKKDEPKNNGAGYEAERESVKTQFALNLPSSISGTQKRMPGTTVNFSEDLTQFNGIECMQIIPYTLGTAPTPGEAAITLGTEPANSNIIVLPGNKISNTDIDNNVHSKLYSTVMMPIGTNALLFYGRAFGSTAIADFGNEATDALRHQYGAMDAYNSTSGHVGLKTNPFTLADVYFAPLKIYSAGRPNGTAGTDADETLIAYLQSVADAQTAAADADKNGNRAWATTTELQLSELYTQFTSGYNATNPGILSGASRNVRAMMSMLWKNVDGLTVDAQFEPLKAAIKAAINNGTYAATAEDGTGSLALASDIANFPEGLASNAMPDGAAAIQWNSSTSQFEKANGTVFGDVTVAQWNKFVYPASLYYFANSAIKTSANDKVAEGFTNSSTYSNDNWKTELDKTTNYDKAAVEASTRSIAMYNPLNYAVGRLDLAVRAKSNAVTTRDAGITLDFTKIPLTAVLISGANDAQWNFTPKTGDKDYIYYDNNIHNSVVNINDAGTWTSLVSGEWNNFTLVLESKTNDNISICLEFLNNDKDFHGINGQLIPKGTKFYLVGTLSPSTGAGYSSGTLDKVFVQDHKTIARITIGDVTGNKAYNVVPDLKVPSLEFALSVDLTWQAGLVFDQTW